MWIVGGLNVGGLNVGGLNVGATLLITPFYLL